jgi:regulator of sirC expression with transglutaminase-like and TPR domain
MDQLGSVAAREELSENERAALLTLLADDDPAVYTTIRQRIISLGTAAADWLRPHTLSRDPVLRRHAQEIVRNFDRQSADTIFLEFCLKQGEAFDLEQGAWLLAQTEYPDINVNGYQALLDSFASDLRERLESAGEPAKVLAAMNRYLFEDLGFAGDQQDYYDPENSYLNRVIDRRSGNPINLCLVYLLLSRRLKLPVTGIGLPGHFICRYQSSSVAIYIDAFSGGKLLTKADCVQYLLQGNYSLREDYLAPVTSRKLLLRVCGNLHQIYLRLDKTEAATRLQRYMIALAR